MARRSFWFAAVFALGVTISSLPLGSRLSWAGSDEAQDAADQARNAANASQDSADGMSSAASDAQDAADSAADVRDNIPSHSPP